jgi:hypothetical protein
MVSFTFGRVETSRKGDPGNPLTFEELVKKFKDLTAEVISERRANQIVETVRNLDKLKTTTNLVKLCRAQAVSRQIKQRYQLDATKGVKYRPDNHSRNLLRIFSEG